MLVETGGQGAKRHLGGDRREVARLLWHVEDGADSRLGGVKEVDLYYGYNAP